MPNSLRCNFYEIVGVVLLVLWVSVVQKSDAEIGVCYGMNGDNLPPPEEVVALCKQHNIQRLRLYNPNLQVLQALQGSNIEVILGVLNDDIPIIAASQANADQWVQQNVKAFSNVRFKYITLGNEVNSVNSATLNSRYESTLLPAIQNLYNSVKSLGIKVTTVFDLGILGNSSPPSAGSFKEEIVPFIKPIIDFLISTNAPICVDVYPYFAYAGNTAQIPLDFALGTSTKVVVQDGPYGYTTLFDAQVDALYSALERVGGGSVSLVVTETGWSSEGGVSTTMENAALYNQKLIPHIIGGTPKRPGKPLETYIFAMFDENQKTAGIEQHWGLFYPNKQPKYEISFNKK